MEHSLDHLSTDALFHRAAERDAEAKAPEIGLALVLLSSAVSVTLITKLVTWIF